MTVEQIQWSPFHPDIFITCSQDWKLKIGLEFEKKNFLSFALQILLDWFENFGLEIVKETNIWTDIEY